MAGVSALKSPVMILHEYCMRRRLELIYTKESVEKLKPTNSNSAPDMSHCSGIESPGACDDNEDHRSKISVTNDNVCLISARTQLNAEEQQLNEQLKLLQKDEEQLDTWLEIYNTESEQQQEQGGKNRKKSQQSQSAKEYEFKVTVGDKVTARGKGFTMKMAKQAAAAAALEQLDVDEQVGRALSNGAASLIDDASSTDSTFETLSNQNPIGAVCQLTRKLRLPQVRYEFTCELVSVSSKSRQRLFTCAAHIYDLILKGTGTSKMKAKRCVANQLLQLLKEAAVAAEPAAAAIEQLSAYVGDVSTATGGAGDVITSEEVKNSFTHQSTTKSDSPPLSTGLLPRLAEGHMKEMERFYDSVKLRMGKTLASISEVPLNRPGTNYCQMLQEISEEQSFSVQYKDLQERTTTGEHQCLVELGCMPAVVCHAVGASVNEAKALAAHNALQYLRIVTKKH